MITNKKGKLYKIENRVKRLEWLISNIDKYKLVHYPWGLSRIDEPQKSERHKREREIIAAMRAEHLFSTNTLNKDININNLILDAVSAKRDGRHITATTKVM